MKEKYGITRITNTTSLDRIGMPVYAAIRPGAHKGSLCVSSGKSVGFLEARTGALCEAIELAVAEYNSERDELVISTVLDFEKKSGLDVYDFPVTRGWLKKIPIDSEIKLVKVQEYNSGASFAIPASLIFLPCPDQKGFAYWGQSSNGLSGGNVFEEALLHGILEVMERDVLSVSRVLKNERRVTDINIPAFLDLRKKIESAGLQIVVTHCENAYNLPMFICYLLDQDYWNGVCIARGQGMHLDKDIALMRAATEAVQSRLTNIHGGRDDIVRRFSHIKQLGERKLFETFDSIYKTFSNFLLTSFSEVPSRPVLPSLKSNLKLVIDQLSEVGFRQIFYYLLSSQNDPYVVLKVVVPNMEFYDPSHFPRIGKRLISYATNST